MCQVPRAQKDLNGTHTTLTVERELPGYGIFILAGHSATPGLSVLAANFPTMSVKSGAATLQSSRPYNS